MVVKYNVCTPLTNPAAFTFISFKGESFLFFAYRRLPTRLLAVSFSFWLMRKTLTLAGRRERVMTVKFSDNHSKEAIGDKVERMTKGDDYLCQKLI